MGQVNIRYFGVTLGNTREEAGTDPRLGRFVSMGDPMPVGTLIEVDGVVHVVSRVDEGAQPGMWLCAEGVTLAATAPTAAMTAVPMPVDDVPTAPMVPDMPLPEDNVPSVIVDDSSGKPDDPKPKRRRSKTVVGR